MSSNAPETLPSPRIAESSLDGPWVARQHVRTGQQRGRAARCQSGRGAFRHCPIPARGGRDLASADKRVHGFHTGWRSGWRAGPWAVAFMHRASAADNPTAPLSHHKFDSQHISFGVVTAAVDHGHDLWPFRSARCGDGAAPDGYRRGGSSGLRHGPSLRLHCWRRAQHPRMAWIRRRARRGRLLLRRAERTEVAVLLASRLVSRVLPVETPRRRDRAHVEHAQVAADGGSQHGDADESPDAMNGMRREGQLRTRPVIMLTVLCAAAVAGLLFVRPGGFSTRVNPSVPERVLARAVRRLAVPRSGRDALNPVSFSPNLWKQGWPHFADHCASCHGNDGRGNTEMRRNLYPKAPDMRQSGTQRLSDANSIGSLRTASASPACRRGATAAATTRTRGSSCISFVI